MERKPRCCAAVLPMVYPMQPVRTMTTTFQVGDVVRHVRHVGARYIIDSIGEVGSRDTEYGITEPLIGGLQSYALGSELRLVCRCPQVSDGSNGWRCVGGSSCEP